MIRVELPYHLRNMARTGREVTVSVEGEPTFKAVLDAVEAQYPMLRGTIRDRSTMQRRPYIRFFACGQDLSHEPLESPLPATVADGTEILRIVGAMSGG